MTRVQVRAAVAAARHAWQASAPKPAPRSPLAPPGKLEDDETTLFLAELVVRKGVVRDRRVVGTSIVAGLATVSLFFSAAGIMIIDQIELDADRLDWQVFAATFVPAIVLLLLVAIGRGDPREVMLAGLGSWAVLGVVSLVAYGASAPLLVMQGLGFPGILATVLLAGDTRARDLWPALKHTPLFLPITVVVLLAPSLTADVWRIAGDLTVGRWIAFAALIPLPLIAVIVVRTRHADTAIDAVLSRELATSVPSREARAVEYAIRLRTPVPKALPGARAWLETGAARRVIADAAQDSALRHAADEVRSAPRARRTIRRRTRTSVLALVTAVFAAASMAVYATTSILVPVHVAEAWCEHVNEYGQIVRIPRLWDELPLYGGPYTGLSCLFGLIAATVMLTGMVVRSTSQGDQQLDGVVDELAAAAAYDLLLRNAWKASLSRSGLSAFPSSHNAD